jgi:uncharacterized protein
VNGKMFFKGESHVSIAEGFVTGSLLFCVGTMTIVGSLNAGLLQPILTNSVISEITCTGSLIIIALGLKILFALCNIMCYT